ncbi:MAG: hypothetical protein PHS14_00105 [Elusimicrobia bacterium]|nr:hypothetical protein [Elusimicrobiota bacterium]
MTTDKTGRPTFTIVIKSPDGQIVEYTGNIWDILREESNASYLGYTTHPKENKPS